MSIVIYAYRYLDGKQIDTKNWYLTSLTKTIEGTLATIRVPDIALNGTAKAYSLIEKSFGNVQQGDICVIYIDGVVRFVGVCSGIDMQYETGEASIKFSSPMLIMSQKAIGDVIVDYVNLYWPNSNQIVSRGIRTFSSPKTQPIIDAIQSVSYAAKKATSCNVDIDFSLLIEEFANNSDINPFSYVLVPYTEKDDTVNDRIKINVKSSVIKNNYAPALNIDRSTTILDALKQIALVVPGFIIEEEFSVSGGQIKSVISAKKLSNVSSVTLTLPPSDFSFQDLSGAENISIGANYEQVHGLDAVIVRSNRVILWTTFTNWAIGPKKQFSASDFIEGSFMPTILANAVDGVATCAGLSPAWQDRADNYVSLQESGEWSAANDMLVNRKEYVHCQLGIGPHVEYIGQAVWADKPYVTSNNSTYSNVLRSNLARAMAGLRAEDQPTSWYLPSWTKGLTKLKSIDILDRVSIKSYLWKFSPFEFNDNTEIEGRIIEVDEFDFDEDFGKITVKEHSAECLNKKMSFDSSASLTPIVPVSLAFTILIELPMNFCVIYKLTDKPLTAPGYRALIITREEAVPVVTSHFFDSDVGREFTPVSKVDLISAEVDQNSNEPVKNKFFNVYFGIPMSEFSQSGWAKFGYSLGDIPFLVAGYHASDKLVTSQSTKPTPFMVLSSTNYGELYTYTNGFLIPQSIPIINASDLWAESRLISGLVVDPTPFLQTLLDKYLEFVRINSEDNVIKRMQFITPIDDMDLASKIEISPIMNANFAGVTCYKSSAFINRVTHDLYSSRSEITITNDISEIIGGGFFNIVVNKGGVPVGVNVDI